MDNLINLRKGPDNLVIKRPYATSQNWTSKMYISEYRNVRIFHKLDGLKLNSKALFQQFNRISRIFADEAALRFADAKRRKRQPCALFIWKIAAFSPAVLLGSVSCNSLRQSIDRLLALPTEIRTEAQRPALEPAEQADKIAARVERQDLRTNARVRWKQAAADGKGKGVVIECVPGEMRCRLDRWPQC